MSEAHPAVGKLLERFVREQLPRAEALEVANLTPLLGGNAREAWSFDLNWSEAGRACQKGCVMLRKREAGQVEADMGREFRTISALGCTGLPIPPALWLDEDGTWLGQPSYVMERVPGVTDRSALLKPEMADISRRVSRQFVEIAARLHTLDWHRLGMDFLGPATPDSAAAAQVSYWEGLFLKHRMEPLPVVCEAFRWLKTHQPVAHRVSIVHGDYRYGNFLYDGGRITALLDWEMVHLGDPVEDIAWSFRPQWSPENFVRLDEFVHLYGELTGFHVDREALAYYRLFSEVKIAVISLTGARAFRDGRTRNLMLADRASLVTTNMRQFLDWRADLEEGRVR